MRVLERKLLLLHQLRREVSAIFGLANAPIYFAKMMTKVFGESCRKGVAFTFYDDICNFGETWDELLLNCVNFLYRRINMMYVVL